MSWCKIVVWRFWVSSANDPGGPPIQKVPNERQLVVKGGAIIDKVL